jgi:hypothetical protein
MSMSLQFLINYAIARCIDVEPNSTLFFFALYHTLGRARDASSLSAETLGQL